MKINKSSKIFIAGHNGMVGSAIKKKFQEEGYKKILTVDKKNLNLIDQTKVFNFLKKNKPNLVIIAAAKVGGIVSNTLYKSQFIYENLQIQNNLIHGSYLAGVKNLFFLGSSCIYPKLCNQPMKEKYLLTGPLEETNDAYAMAKISGIMMCDNYNKNYKLNYRSFMPSNMYGPNDNYNLKNSHFFSALLKKIYQAKISHNKTLTIWGTGKAHRELLFVEDLADAILFFINKKFKEPFINIGSGKDYSIEWYAKFIMKQLGVKLKIKFDKSKPDGMPKKLLDVSLAKKYGWKSKTSLKEGFRSTFNSFIKKYY